MNRLSLPVVVIGLIAALLLFSWVMQRPKYTPEQREAARKEAEARSEQGEHENDGARLGSYVQDFTIRDLKGQTIALSDYKGKKPFVIVLWTPREGMNQLFALDKLAAMERKYQSDSYGIVNIAYGTFYRRVADLLSATPLPGRNAVDADGDVVRKLVPMPMSIFLVIDKNGVVTRTTALSSARLDLIEGDLKTLAGGKTPTTPGMPKPYTTKSDARSEHNH